MNCTNFLLKECTVCIFYGNLFMYSCQIFIFAELITPLPLPKLGCFQNRSFENKKKIVTTK